MQTQVAQILLETQAVKLSPSKPFKWSSGWNSPIYCDNRTVLSHAAERRLIKESMAKKIKEQFPEADTLIGVATAGIAIGALVADYMGLSYAYCRPKPKEHGLKRQLEGHVHPGSKIVVVEDLISTGGSSLKVVDYLRSEGYEVQGMAAIFTYGFQLAEDNFKASSCEYCVLSDYDTLIQQAVTSGYVNADDVKALSAWRENPSEWGK